MINKMSSTAGTQTAVRVMNGTIAGRIVLTASEAGIVSLVMRRAGDGDEDIHQQGSAPAAAIADKAVMELSAYLRGELRRFSVPLSLEGLSDFQHKVLTHTAQIPAGSVESYGEVAQAIGKPNSARAVGGALAHNPIAIMIPCHRVVAHDGGLHGFSSPDGIRTKAKLLAHEGLSIIDDRVQLSEKREM